MAILMPGGPVGKALSEKTAQNAARLRELGVTATLEVIRVGQRPEDMAYERAAMKRAQAVGVQVHQTLLPADARPEELVAALERVNRDDSVHGCLLFRPLPEQLSAPGLTETLCPEKDVDGMTAAGLGGLMTVEPVSYTHLLSEVWAKGGEGGMALAEEVVRLAEDKTNDHFQFVYDLEDSIEEKLNKIATKVYRADGVVLAGDAKKQAKQLAELGFANLPICMAKTQFSFSDDQTKLGAPRGFKITVREIKVNAGAGFLVAKTGNIMTMPGLPKVPAAERIDIDANGKITGLF